MLVEKISPGAIQFPAAPKSIYPEATTAERDQSPL